MNCSVGAFYGLPLITPQRTSLLVTNLIGIVFQTMYLAIFTAHARDKPRVASHLYISQLHIFLSHRPNPSLTGVLIARYAHKVCRVYVSQPHCFLFGHGRCVDWRRVVVVFMPYSQQYVLQLLGSYATFMALLVILVMGVLPPESRSSTVGYCMVAFTVIMFGAPMASLVGPDIDPRTGLLLFASYLPGMPGNVAQ